MRYAAKRDANDSELIKLWREIVGPNRDVREGPFDYWIVIRTAQGFGFWQPLEIKNLDGKNKYTAKQRRLIEFAKQNDLPFITWRTRDDVLQTAKARVTA